MPGAALCRHDPIACHDWAAATRANALSGRAKVSGNRFGVRDHDRTSQVRGIASLRLPCSVLDAQLRANRAEFTPNRALEPALVERAAAMMRVWRRVASVCLTCSSRVSFFGADPDRRARRVSPLARSLSSGTAMTDSRGVFAASCTCDDRDDLSKPPIRGRARIRVFGKPVTLVTLVTALPVRRTKPGRRATRALCEFSRRRFGRDAFRSWCWTAACDRTRPPSCGRRGTAGRP
jgi:hypothetical protein